MLRRVSRGKPAEMSTTSVAAGRRYSAPRSSTDRYQMTYQMNNSRLGCDWRLQNRLNGLATATRRCGDRRCVSVRMALLDPPPFNPSKLKVMFFEQQTGSVGKMEGRRRYTLTHNDLTGQLTLSIGSEYNAKQLSGWYTKIVRDEVLAEWIIKDDEDGVELHVYCHVSGEEMWPAPAPLRSFIFQREMTLVLDTIAYAEKELLMMDSLYRNASVFVHLASDIEPLNEKISWGLLGDRSTWRIGPKRTIFDLLINCSDDDFMYAERKSSKDEVPTTTVVEEDRMPRRTPLPHRSSVVSAASRTNKIVLEGIPSIIPAKLDTVSADVLRQRRTEV